MKREIYIVQAEIVDSNGTYNALPGYPKSFDSKNYGNDTNTAYKRATGDFSEVKGAMCKRDDRQLQEARIIRISDNFIIDSFKDGALADIPDPEPTPSEE